MQPLNLLILLFGVMNLAMGIQAYVSTRSLPSLLAAGTIGLIILSTSLLFKTNPKISYIATFVCCLLLLGRFLPVYLKDMSKVYPHLIVVVTASLMLIGLVVTHFTQRQSTH